MYNVDKANCIKCTHNISQWIKRNDVKVHTIAVITNNMNIFILCKENKNYSAVLDYMCNNLLFNQKALWASGIYNVIFWRNCNEITSS